MIIAHTLNIVQRGQWIAFRCNASVQSYCRAADSRHRSALPDSYIQQLQQLQRGDTVCDIWASVLTMMHILSVWRLGLGRSGNCWAHTIRADHHHWNSFLIISDF